VVEGERDTMADVVREGVSIFGRNRDNFRDAKALTVKWCRQPRQFLSTP
jgi:hypothetical protein